MIYMKDYCQKKTFLWSQPNSAVVLHHGLNNELLRYINNMMMMMLCEVSFNRAVSKFRAETA